ncbi:MAG: hypothetical protein C5B54_07090 [Acidobacteria bacterium]|nr:MAG: hypothetical protein C5B54_07090 [Acidobacteriota bacterium]
MGLDVTLMPVNRILGDEKRAVEHQSFLKQTGFSMPAGSSEDFHYTEQVGPYAIYHHLWRYAAYLDVKGEPPLDPGTHPLDDPIYQQCIAKQETHFDQLLRHSEDNGYYYPIDFPKIIQVTPQKETGFLKKFFGGSKEAPSAISFGSANRLLKELEEINKFLHVPVREESPSQTYEDGIHGELWGDEMWSWIVLFFMSRKAVEHGQIVVFE